MEQNGQKTITVHAGPEQLKGGYSNLFQVSHPSGEELIFDFLFIDQVRGFAALTSRIVMSPQQAKRVLAALEDNIKKYEAQHGVITLGAGSSDSHEVGFTVK